MSMQIGRISQPSKDLLILRLTQDAAHYSGDESDWKDALRFFIDNCANRNLKAQTFYSNNYL